MAELTLVQRGEMASSESFQRRVIAAVKKTANYWKDYSMDQVAHFNKAIEKRKVFARKVLSQTDAFHPLAYAQYILTQYNEVSPVLIQDGSEYNGQVADSVLTDSPASSTTFDFFAGVVAGDEAEKIEF